MLPGRSTETKDKDLNGDKPRCDKCGRPSEMLVPATWVQRRREERDDGQGVDLTREQHSGEVCVSRCVLRAMQPELDDAVRDGLQTRGMLQ